MSSEQQEIAQRNLALQGLGQEAAALGLRYFNDQASLGTSLKGAQDWLTKADGDARGGAALSVREITGTPLLFIGTGEKSDALEPFHHVAHAQDAARHAIGVEGFERVALLARADEQQRSAGDLAHR